MGTTKEQAKIKRLMFSEWLNTKKTKCIRCGQKDPAFIKFVHREGEKKFDLDASAWSRKKTDVSEELLKCVCICLSCLRLEKRRMRSGTITIAHFHKRIPHADVKFITRSMGVPRDES